MRTSLFAFAALMAVTAPAMAGPAQDKMLAHFQAQAQSPASTARGQSLFEGRFTGGKPETPSCTSCHTASPAGVGKTRAGKEIAPMALSKSPERYSDLKKVEKWFRRNCKSVLGRACSAQEKTDFIAFMISQ